MATTIENFLIGIGLEYDKSGEKQSLAAIGSIKSKALQLAAVMGGAFGAKKLTFDAAESAASLSRMSKALGISQKSITAFGSAIQQEGGSLGESIGLLQTFTQLQDDLQKNLRPEIFGELSRIGVDANLVTSIKNAENAEKAIASVIQAIQGLSPETQRKALSVIGADSQALLLTAQKGIKNYENVVSEAVGRLKTDADLGAQSEKFNVELLKFNETIGSISREISMELIPPITQVISGMTGWIDANREFISSGIESTTKVVGENIKAIGIGLGVLGAAATLKSVSTVFGVVKSIGSIGKGGAGGGGLCCPGEGGKGVDAPDGKKGKGGKVGKIGKVLGGLAIAGAVFEVVNLAGDALTSIHEERVMEDAKASQFGVFDPSNRPASEFAPSRGAMNTDSSTSTNGVTAPIGSGASVAPSNQRVNQPITINATLEVDGEVLARKTINAMEFDNTKTLSELSTSTGG